MQHGMTDYLLIKCISVPVGKSSVEKFLLSKARELRFRILDSECGRIMGPGGIRIGRVRRETGAFIDVNNTLVDGRYRRVHIVGRNRLAAVHARDELLRLDEPEEDIEIEELLEVFARLSASLRDQPQ